jgi:hypothetical protein
MGILKQRAHQVSVIYCCAQRNQQQARGDVSSEGNSSKSGRDYREICFDWQTFKSRSGSLKTAVTQMTCDNEANGGTECGFCSLKYSSE